MAAFIPLVLSVAGPLLQNELPKLFDWIARGMDKIFGNGTGPTKFSVGSTIAQTILAATQKLLNDAKSGVSIPTDPAEIQKLLQDTVTALNNAKQLNGAATVLDPSSMPVSPNLRALGISLLHTATAILETPGI